MGNREDYYKKDVLRLALFMGELMLSNGAETSRVEDTMKRMCSSRGYKYINVFISPTSIIISDSRFDGVTFLSMIKSRDINLNKIVLFNDFSRKFVADKSISVEDALKELKYLNKNAQSYPDIINYLMTGIGSASFAYLIGGDNILNFMLTIFASMIACFCYDKVWKITDISAFASLVASILVTLIAVGLTELSLISSPTTMIVGSIMPLLCGVAFVKGVRDLVKGDLISGGARISEACLTSIALASGVGIILDMWIKVGGVL